MPKKKITEAYYYQFVDFLKSAETLVLKENEYYLSANNLLHPYSHAMPSPFYLLNFQKQEFLHINEDFVDLSGYYLDNLKKLNHEDFFRLHAS